jgi:hypothetical protein
VITVLFRPLLSDAHSFQVGVAALEGTFLLLLSIVRFPSMLRAVKSMRRQPYVAFVIAYAVMFILTYSSIANFGILARERVQLLPFYVLLLSMPRRERADELDDLHRPPESDRVPSP